MTAPCARGMVNNAYISIVLASGTLRMPNVPDDGRRKGDGHRRGVSSRVHSAREVIHTEVTYDFYYNKEKKKRKNVD